ncbi:MAG: hypothetical protein LKI50_01955 [Leuconostoc mesenteroides]|nr:hypothetical protein [Leuconostoc mesenteroides]
MSKAMKITVVLIDVMMIILNIVWATHDLLKILPVVMCTLSLAMVTDIRD